MNINKAVNINDLREFAREYLPRIVFDYIDGGVEEEACLLRNRKAFDRYCFVPRYLVDVSQQQQSVNLFGHLYASPFGIAPTGLAGFSRPGADLMMAKAAAEANIPFVMSGAATTSIEKAVKVSSPAHLWYQLYVARDARVTADLVRRAGDAGVECLVLTVDVPVHPKRERDIRNGFVAPVKPTLGAILNILCHPRWLLGILRHGLPRFENWAPYAAPDASAKDIADLFTAQIPFTQTWHELEAIRKIWPGKLLLKGILHPDDALKAVSMGVDAIIVSNHGGRVFDYSPSTLDAFAGIRQAVGSSITLMLDSGIRRGADILKACALGADFVFVGRPVLYGVAAGGESGAKWAITILQDEINLFMRQIGCVAPEQLAQTLVLPQNA